MERFPLLDTQDYVLVWECECGESYISAGKRDDVYTEVATSAFRHRAKCGGQVMVFEPGSRLLKV